MMDIQALAEKLGGVSVAVLGKAQELLRMLEIKLQCGGNAVPMLGRPAACIELASELLQEPLNSQKLFKLSGGTSFGKYKQTIRTISGILRVQSTKTITTSSLCVKFGCPALKEFVSTVHDDYKHRMIAKLNAQQRAHVDMSRPLFPAAVFFACAQKANLRVDKNQLLHLTLSQPKEFASVVSSIEVNILRHNPLTPIKRLSEHALSTFVPTEPTLKLGRKRRRADKEEETTDKENRKSSVQNGSSVVPSGNTRSLDHIKKLIEAQTSAKPLESQTKPTKVVATVAVSPSYATKDEYADWKKKILAQMAEK